MGEAIKMRETADWYYQSGLAQLKEGQYPEALHQFEGALPIFQELGDRRGEAESLLNIGFSYKELAWPWCGNALNFFEQALLESWHQLL